MRNQLIKTRISVAKVIAVAAVAFGILFLLSACGQSGSAQSSGGSESAEQQSSEAAEASSSQSEGSLLDAAKDAAGKVKNKAADATTKAKEDAKARAAEQLEKAELTQTTKELEYSGKKAKPLGLVECSNPEIEVASEGEVDLSELGSKTVTYTLSLDGQSMEREVTFEVRDTKSPEIDFVSKAPKVDVGTDYDPAQNINYVKDPVDGELALVDAAPEAQGAEAAAETFYDEGWYTVEGSVDTSVAGVYSIDVNAADIHGNTAHRTFDVTVVAPESEAEAAPDVHPYVLNTNSHKFHHPGCRAVKQMNDSNRQDVEMTREEVIGMGYEPCGICTP